VYIQFSTNLLQNIDHALKVMYEAEFKSDKAKELLKKQKPEPEPVIVPAVFDGTMMAG
jgi:hypothetical protein